MRRTPGLLMCLLLLACPALADNWPAWRGPHATGVCDERGLPVTWSATQHFRWKVPLPAPGNGTPIRPHTGRPQFG